MLAGFTKDFDKKVGGAIRHRQGLRRQAALQIECLQERDRHQEGRPFDYGLDIRRPAQ